LVNAQQLWAVLGGDSHDRAFARRLATLFHAGVIDRPPQQFRGGRPAQHYVYAVGPRGREHLDRLDGITSDGKRAIRAKNNILKFNFLQHETAVAEVALAFQLATERQGWSFELALGDEIPIATGLPSGVDIAFTPDVKGRLPLCPDAHVVIDAGDGARRVYFLEVDLDTEPQIRWNLRTSSILRKVIAYWQVAFWRPAPVDGVIFVTTRPRRLAKMIDVVRRVDPKHKGSHFFHFALLDHCRIENHAALFYEPLFRSAKTGYDNPRPLFLDTCPKCHQSVDPSNEPYDVLANNPASQYAHAECPGLR